MLILGLGRVPKVPVPAPKTREKVNCVTSMGFGARQLRSAARTYEKPIEVTPLIASGKFWGGAGHLRHPAPPPKVFSSPSPHTAKRREEGEEQVQ